MAAMASQWWAHVTAPDSTSHRPVKVFAHKTAGGHQTDMWTVDDTGPVLLASFPGPVIAGRGVTATNETGDWVVTQVSCGCGSLAGLKQFVPDGPA